MAGALTLVCYSSHLAWIKFTQKHECMKIKLWLLLTADDGVPGAI